MQEHFCTGYIVQERHQYIRQVLVEKRSGWEINMAYISGYDSYSMATLFSGTGNNGNGSAASDFLGISYTDYASIRNGSYRKLVSSYYRNVEDEDKTASSASGDSRQTLESVRSAAGELKESAAALLDKGKNSLFKTTTDEKGNRSTDYDTEKVYKAVRDFVDDYNSLLDSAAESDTTRILRSAKSMVAYTEANRKVLAQVGITIGSDNKLSVDEDKFKEASKADVESLFHSQGGYLYQISAKATSIDSYAAIEAKKAGETSRAESYKSAIKSTSTSKDSAKTLGSIKEAAETAAKTLDILRENGAESLFRKMTQTNEAGNTVSDYNRDAIHKAVSNFVKDYNALLDKTEDSDTANILQARKTMMNYAASHKSALSAAGITIDADGKLALDGEKLKNADMTKVKALFQDRYGFGEKMGAQIEKIASYAEKEAAKSNTYSGSGSYSANYTAGEWYNSLI